MLAGRRIDELRVSEERLQRNLRENDMRRLATEAELRALRAQLNPHFLFNALTTVGHLITTSPSRAIETLYQLTALLRAVLRRTTDLVTLREELHLVDAYLAIEQTRFEERLTIERDIPDDLGDVLVPPLILQPIVENAVKHGISPQPGGGSIAIRARIEDDSAIEGGMRLWLSVHDTGPGLPDVQPRRRRRGVGMQNVADRLTRYYGTAGVLRLTSDPATGTLVELGLTASHQTAEVAT